jgi:hypothetical protein
MVLPENGFEIIEVVAEACLEAQSELRPFDDEPSGEAQS